MSHEDTSNPFVIMRRHGFNQCIMAARRVLPDDWWKRYDLNPNQVARALTYYCCYDDYTQEEIARRYGFATSQSISWPYRVLRKDLGLPQNNSKLDPLFEDD